MTINWIGGIFSAIVLLLLFVLGLILQNPVRLLITGKRAEGIVVGMTGEGALKTPMVEFVTSTGERIRVNGRSYSASNSTHKGDAVTVAYSRSNPRDAQLLLLKDFPLGPAGFVLGFIAVILLMWISGILISGDPGLVDPFHLLPAVISHFRLNPFRFPALFILSFAIPACGLGTYLTYMRAHDLRSNGIKAVGHVIGLEKNSSTLSDGSTASGVFPMITFEDAAGAPQTIRRSLAKPLSRLKPGDTVEVIYLAHQPNKGVVNTWDELWPPPLFFGFMMLAFLVAFRLVLSGTIRS
jgi:ribosomal 50S subunit-recycling heat shock protein